MLNVLYLSYHSIEVVMEISQNELLTEFGDLYINLMVVDGQMGTFIVASMISIQLVYRKTDFNSVILNSSTLSTKDNLRLISQFYIRR